VPPNAIPSCRRFGQGDDEKELGLSHEFPLLPSSASCDTRCLWNTLEPYVATAFEEQAQKLGLTEQTCVSSEEMRHWCERNKDRRYVPEWLLKRWRIAVDPNVSG